MSNESHNHILEDCNLVRSPPYGFYFEAKINYFCILNKLYFPVKFAVSLIIFVNDCRVDNCCEMYVFSHFRTREIYCSENYSCSQLY